MSYAGTITLTVAPDDPREHEAYIQAKIDAGLLHSAGTDTGKCCCGWQAPEWVADVAAATLEHLYGHLTGPARQFAWPEENE